MEQLTEELLKSEKFVHSFLTIIRPALNTFSEEKIRRFARILLTAIEKNEMASDKFEEYVKLLESLTERQIDILCTIQRLESKALEKSQNTVTGSKSSIQIGYSIQNWVMEVTYNIWDEFIEDITNRHQITKEQLMSQLDRLEGMGLYSGRQAVGYRGQEIRNIGTSTFLFDEFSQWIKLENEKLNADG
jgi:hypothetical protein